MHEPVEFFRSTSLVDVLARSAYDGVSHVRCIFWEPESLGRASVVSVSHDTCKNLTYPGYYSRNLYINERGNLGTTTLKKSLNLHQLSLV